MVSERGSILLEAAIVLPAILVLAFGVLGTERVLHAQAGVQAVAHDAARAAALAGDAAQAPAQGVASGMATATDYTLDPGDLALTLDAADFRRGGQVAARASYVVTFSDLPFFGWASISVQAADVQPVDVYRALPGGQQ